MTVEDLFEKFREAFEDSGLSAIDSHTKQNIVAGREKSFQRRVSKILLEEYSNTTMGEMNIGFSLFLTDIEEEKFKEMLASATKKLVEEVKFGTSKEILDDKKEEEISLVKRFILALATLGIYEMYYRITHNEKANTKFHNLIEYCQEISQQRISENELAISTKSFPRPQTGWGLFGGKAQESSREETIKHSEAQHDFIRNALKRDKAARQIQAAFRESQHTRSSLDFSLRETGTRAWALEKEKTMHQERKEALSASLAEKQIDRSEFKKILEEKVKLQSQRDQELQALSSVYNSLHQQLDVIEKREMSLTMEIEKLNQEKVANVPSTWGLWDRDGNQAKEQERISGLDTQIRQLLDEQKKLSEGEEKSNLLVKIDENEKEIIATQRKIDKISEEIKALSQFSKEALDEYSVLAKREKNAERRIGEVEQKETTLGKFTRRLHDKASRYANAAREYATKSAESKEKLAAEKAEDASIVRRIEELEHEKISNAPRTWGLWDRAGNKAIEQQRVAGLEARKQDILEEQKRLLEERKASKAKKESANSGFRDKEKARRQGDISGDRSLE